MLHGAGGQPGDMLDLVRDHAARANLLVIAPKSVAPSWDAADGELGPDVAELDRALEAVFAAHAIDPARVAIGGFSDGASYALTLGLTNGELFRHVLAFAPGFIAARSTRGAPRIFVAHGTDDRVLSVRSTREHIVAVLQRAGLAVDYHEVAGGHAVSPEMLERAFAWLGR